MPNSRVTQASVDQLVLAYVSMFCVLLLLLISGQVLVQVALAHGAHVRLVAAMIERQELRTQHMFYNVILLQSPGTAPGTTYQSITASVESDEISWEIIQQAMYTGDERVQIFPSDFSAHALAVLNREKPAYTKMRDTYRRVLASEHADNPSKPEAVRPDVGTIYLLEANYLQSLVDVYEDLTAQADAYAHSVQVIEIVLFALSALIVLPAEAFFVARPAVRHLREQMQLLARTLHLDDGKEIKKP